MVDLVFQDLKLGKTSQHLNWPRYMDWRQIGPKIAIKQGKKTPKGQMVPILRAHREGLRGVWIKGPWICPFSESPASESLLSESLFSESLLSESLSSESLTSEFPGLEISVSKRVPVWVFSTFGIPDFGIPGFGSPESLTSESLVSEFPPSEIQPNSGTP